MRSRTHKVRNEAIRIIPCGGRDAKFAGTQRLFTACEKQAFDDT
jgi:hypothetical protein